MPFYEYKTEDGEIVTHFCSYKNKPKELKLEDGRVAKPIISRVGILGTSSSGWPYACRATGVAPHQREELGKFLKGKGVPTEITKDGRPIYENSVHREKALKARSMVDYDAYK